MFDDISNTTLITTLIIIYFLISSITVAETRILQGKKNGTLPEDEPVYPAWTGILYYINWGIIITLLIINWKIAIIVYVAKFILSVIPVLETIGNIISSPLKVSPKKDNTKYIIKENNELENAKKLFIEREFEKAYRAFTLAIEDGYESESFKHRALCLQQMERNHEAIEDFNHAISYSKNDCSLYYSRAISKKVIGDKEGCRLDLEKALKIAELDYEENQEYAKAVKEQGYQSLADFFHMQILFHC